jgi:hypothetical protein
VLWTMVYGRMNCGEKQLFLLLEGVELTGL